jgi:putative protease
MNGGVDKPELLAPAGTIEAGLAAFDAGADAVYAGLPRFNARERGRNFTLEELGRLIAWAHRHGRKVYVTLNTLIKEAELGEAAGMLAELALFRPDAVLVQDLGLVRLIREHFPVLEIHASTQMGIHNSAGARLAERLGIRRVILERQTTFEEIAEIRRNSSVDLEIFVHGALCCSRSGACLFSSWMGGWSGNRGKCKQPCRRRFHAPGGNGFFFSTRDLYSLDAIPELKRLGVRSLKIEGRLRRADYVSRVVAAYRMMLDAGDGPEEERPLKEAKALLSGALGRKWKPAFRSAADFSDTIQHRTIGSQGLLCGKVKRVSENGFLVAVSRTLRLRDRIRIQPDTGDEGPAVTITKMSVNRRNATHARKGEVCWIHCDKPVAEGSMVYKTGLKPPDMAQRIEGLPAPRPAMDLEISLGEKGIRVKVDGVRASSGAMDDLPVFELALELQEARSRPLTAAVVRNEFRKTRSEKFEAGSMKVELPEARFLPASRLKEVRRAFWEWADRLLDEETLRKKWRERVRAFEEEMKHPISKGEAKPRTVVRLGGEELNPVKGGKAARPLAHSGKDTCEAILPEFCPELELPALKKRIRRAVAQGVKRFRVTSLFGFELLAEHRGVRSTATFPIPVCNRLALSELMSLGAECATAWVELDEEALAGLREGSGERIEVFTFGRIPLLSTRFEIPVSGEISDSRGARFRVVEEGGLTWLFPEKVLSLPAPSGVSRYMDLSHADPDEETVDSFNYFRELV